jgi:hypothetical protein
MGWCVRNETPQSFFELSLATDAVAPARLVPGDGDVDEALEIIAFSRPRRAPRQLELLVRGEELPPIDQVEPAVEVRGYVSLRCFRPSGPARRRIVSGGHEIDAISLSDCASQWYPPGVATILVAGVDLFFRGKLDALLGQDHKLVTTDSAYSPDLVIVDIARIDPEEVAESWPDIPILGFTNHTDTTGLRAAQAAGFDRVVVRSALAERASEIVEELVA